MARRQLAAEVTDVQAARLLAWAGAHPSRGSQKREGFLGGQKLLVRSGGRRLVRHGWRWPSSGYLSGPGLLPGPPCPHSKLSALAATPGCAAAVHLRAPRPPLPWECGAARRGCTGPQPSGSRSGSPEASAAHLVPAPLLSSPPRLRSAAAARPAHCAGRPSPPSAGRDWKGSRKRRPAPPAGAEEELNLHNRTAATVAVAAAASLPTPPSLWPIRDSRR